MILKKGMRTTRCALLGICLLIALLGVGMLGCQKAPEEVIKEGVRAEFESIKTLDEEALQDIVAGMEASGGLSAYGIDSEEFCRVWLEGFDYTLGEVSVSGNEATASLDITCKSFSSALQDFQARATELSADEAVQDMTLDEINAKVGELLMESMKEAPTTTTSVVLPYTLENNTWVAGSGFYPALLQALMGEGV